MRIISRTGLTATVARIRTPLEVVVAIPAGLPSSVVLDLARLVLSGGEYEQLRSAMQRQRGSDGADEAAAGDTAIPASGLGIAGVLGPSPDARP